MEIALQLCAAAASALLIAISGCGTAFAQKPGGILRMPCRDGPASMSIHEESAIIAERAMMGSSTILSFSTSMCSKTARNRLCQIWPLAGHGVRMGLY